MTSEKSFEWVELFDSKSQQIIYANLTSGECSHHPPPNQAVKPRSSDQWWELFDVKAQRNYYYNCNTHETFWQKPESGDIISLASLQLLNDDTQPNLSGQKNDRGDSSRSEVHNSSTLGSKPPGQASKSSLTTEDQTNPSHHRKWDRSSHQRIREWLQDADTVPTDEDSRVMCFSDRPVRRMHHISHPTSTTPSGHYVNDKSSSPPIKNVSTTSGGSTLISQNSEFAPVHPPDYQTTLAPTTLSSTIPAYQFPKHHETLNTSLASHHTKAHIGVDTMQHTNSPSRPFSPAHPQGLQRRPCVFPRTNPTASRCLSNWKPNFPGIDFLPDHVRSSGQFDSSTGQPHMKSLTVTSAHRKDTPPSGSLTRFDGVPLAHTSTPHKSQAVHRDTDNQSSSTTTRPFLDWSAHSVSTPDSSDTSLSITSSERADDFDNMSHYLGDTGKSSAHAHEFDREAQQLASDTNMETRPNSEPVEQPPTPPPRSASVLGSHAFGWSAVSGDARHTAYSGDHLKDGLSDMPFGVRPLSTYYHLEGDSRASLAALANRTNRIISDTAVSPGVNVRRFHSERNPYPATGVTTKTLFDSSGAMHETAKNFYANGESNESDRTAMGAAWGPASPTHWDAKSFECEQGRNTLVVDKGSNLSTLSSTLSQKLLNRPFYTLIYPGHSAFGRFTCSFDWPKDLFKADREIDTLMSWTKAKFTKRILACTDPALKKQAADLFSIVQSFMGDRKARLSLPDYGSIIIHRALNSVALRDELYSQLCKQTTNNPNMKSLTNGWALLCICLYYFPPNNNVFRDALKSYLVFRAETAVDRTMTNTKSFVKRSEQSSLHVAAAIASAFTSPHSSLPLDHTAPNGCVNSSAPASATNEDDDPSLFAVPPVIFPVDLTLGTCDRPTAPHFARVAPRWLKRSINLGSRKVTDAPSLSEICHVKNFVLKPCVFGGSLEEIMHIQSSRFPHLRLPWIQLFLTEEILRMNGASTEGIFRLSADADLITETRCQFEKLFEVFKVCEKTPHSSASQTESISHSDRFFIPRPPPPGWILFQNRGEPVPAMSDMPKSPSLPDATYLTGEFSWPLIPTPLTSSPTEFILLTPSSQWPRSLKVMVNRIANDCSADQVDAHLATALLKSWLRELAYPLIPRWLHSECLQAALNAESAQVNNAPMANADVPDAAACSEIQACCQLIRKLPALNRRCLLYLVLLLQHMAKPEHSAVSLMDARNLAIVISPNLWGTSGQDMMLNIRPLTSFLRILIIHLNVPEEINALYAEENQ